MPALQPDQSLGGASSRSQICPGDPLSGTKPGCIQHTAGNWPYSSRPLDRGSSLKPRTDLLRELGSHPACVPMSSSQVKSSLGDLAGRSLEQTQGCHPEQMGRVLTLSQPGLRVLRALNGELRSTGLQTEGRCVCQEGRTGLATASNPICLPVWTINIKVSTDATWWRNPASLS